jgi:hypothetical protein
MKGESVFGGVERESGKIFLVPVLARIANTLTTTLRVWIETGTVFICDSSSEYQNLKTHGCTHKTVNHTMVPLCAYWGAYEHDRKHVAAFEGIPTTGW